jgi:DNA-binding NarL/FixJ family response regulator
MVTQTEVAPLRVALVNDFEVILRGIEAMLNESSDRIVVIEKDVRTSPSDEIDVALFDTYGQAGGLERVRSLASDPDVGAVAVYTWRLDTAQADRMLAAGARGVLDKSMAGPELTEALLAIGSGETVVSPIFRDPTREDWPGLSFGLTARESEVAAFLVQGLSNHDMAEALFLSEHTVKSHLKSMFQKLGVASRGHAITRIVSDTDFRRIADSAG